MSFALMQPYFFPYQGYFSLIDSVDRFMFFDDVQYVRKSWMSRNQLLNLENGEPFYFRPGIIKPKYGAQLQDVKLEDDDGWKNKIIQQTSTYKNVVPYYDQVAQLLEEILSESGKRLVDFNIKSTIHISRKLGIRTEIEKYSDYDIRFDEKPSKGTWGLKVTDELNEDVYINSSGGESFIRPEEFSKIDIKLGFIQPNLSDCKQTTNNFIPGLSILDVLFINGINETAKKVKCYNIKWVN